MPQTKTQKHASAVERERRTFSYHQQRWQSWQDGGDAFKTYSAGYGPAYAQKRQHSENRIWQHYLIRAELDTSGNPLCKEQVELLKDKYYARDRDDHVVVVRGGVPTAAPSISTLIPEGPEPWSD